MKIFRFLKLAVAVIFAGTLLSQTAFAQQTTGTPRLDPVRATVRLRVSYWETPKNAPDVLYYQDGAKFVPFQIYQRAFLKTVEYRGPAPITIFRKATQEEVEQRKQTAGLTKAEREYVPVFQIKTGGLRDVAVLILPVEKVEDITEKKVLVFDYSESAFPFGSICIMNLSRHNLIGQFAPRGQEPQSFRLGAGKRFISAPIKERVHAYELSLAARVKGEPTLVFSAPALVFSSKRSLIFAMSTKTAENGVPEYSFCQITERKPPAEKVKEKSSRAEKSSTKADRDNEKKRSRK